MRKVENYIDKHRQWKEELILLRRLMLESGMEETVKWGTPVYTVEGKNVAGLAAFKHHLGIWFFQGALLKDSLKVLTNAQEGKTKAIRQWRFTDLKQIKESQIKRYLSEAIQNQKAGKRVPVARGIKKPLVIPPRLQEALQSNAKIATQFHSLSLPKKREFAEYIEQAKRERTKESRLVKVLALVKEGKGLYDKYQ